MNTGTSRKSREAKALAPDYIVMDERTMQDMVNSTLKYSESVNYFDYGNSLADDWKPFFLKDPIFIIAYIANTDISSLKENNDKIFNKNIKIHQIKGNTAVAEISNNLSEMTALVREWSDLLSNSDYKGALVEEINKLKESIEEKELIGNLDRPKDLNYYYNKFNNIHARIFHFKETINKKFKQETVLEHNHLPHIGLILAFYKLFHFAQLEINQLTKRHLDYYYRILLQEKQHTDNLQSHTAMIACELKHGVENLIVDKGAVFNIDFGEGQEAEFLADTPTQINRAVIAVMRTICKKKYEPFESRDALDPFCYEVLYETDILKRINDLKDHQINSFEDFPMTFGEENQDPCDLGFVISSPSLILEKGVQEIELEFKLVKDIFEDDSKITEKNKFTQLLDKEYELFLEKYENNAAQKEKKGIQLKGLTEKEKKSEKESLKKSVKMKFFKQAFNIYITNKEGWKQIEYSQITLKDKKIKIRIPLNSINNQLVSFDPSIHNGNHETEWPCIKILLNNQATYHPYIFLKDCALEYISIDTDVSDVSNLKLSNSIGEIDNTVPFAPFGPIPEIASFLRIQNPLILQKNLVSLEFEISWYGLPQLQEGFKNYYQQYKMSIDNDSFKAFMAQTRNLDRSASVMKNKEFSLFELDIQNYLKNLRDIKVNLEDFEFNNKILQVDGAVVDNKASIYVILKRPNMSFGHGVFAQIYAKSAMNSSRFFSKSEPLPRQPYTPVIGQLKARYKNSVKENVLRIQDEEGTKLKLIHLYPFGQVMVFPGSVKSPFYLFPQINKKGNLFIGLENVMPLEEVSIGLELIPAVNFNTVIKGPQISWKYLNNNKWENLMDYVLKDGTNGFIRSGIVKLQIPGSIQIDNTRLGGGKFWIKAEYDGIEELNSRVKHVFTQAISVRSETPSTNNLFDVKTEKKVVRINPVGNKNIENILGPMHLVTNDNTKDDVQFYTRVSERLRHKNRGVTNWDIERIIIERFDQIEKVRVYGRNNHPKELIQGSTTQVVVIPKNNKEDIILSQGNKFDIDTLQKIKTYIKKFVSPFVKIEVCNPVFEELKVRCRIEFEDGLNLKAQLNQDLIAFLSPNSIDSDIDTLFEKSFTKSEIYKFIKERPYVKKIKEFSVIQLINVNEKHKIIDTEEVIDSKKSTIWGLTTISAYAILTSAPLHHIELWRSEEDKIQGIGDIAIGSDFIISEEVRGRNTYIED